MKRILHRRTRGQARPDGTRAPRHSFPRRNRSLPGGLQVKLFRALQERQIRRVGGTKQIDVNIRLVSATNRDLRDLASKGNFREELYYRINVIAVALPPLRSRKGDVALLAHTFLKKYGRNHATLRGFDPEAMNALEAYSWPGNVRELQNIIERACALAEGETATLHDLPEHVRTIAAVGKPISSPASIRRLASRKPGRNG